MSRDWTPPSYSSQSVYTPDQVEAYYERISLPAKWRLEVGQNSQAVAHDPEKGLAFLTAIQRHHLANIPFENLDLHYNRHHDIFIDPPHLFRKIIENARGRGGYCMETCGLLGMILRSLGFDVYPTGARVRNSSIDPEKDSRPIFNGWDHMLHIVTIGPKRYEVDVGLGTAGPTAPLLLNDTSAEPTVNIAPQLRRLRRAQIPGTTKMSGSQQLWWVYETQNEPGLNGPWEMQYCFNEVEFLPTDFEMMNFWTSRSPTIFFTREIVCMKHILSEGEVIGTIALTNKTFKRREYGKKTTELELNSEADRVAALRTHLGVILLEDETHAIQGSCTEVQ